MATPFPLKCQCKGKLEPRERIRGEKRWGCIKCNKEYVAKRSDRTWRLVEVIPRAKKSGIIAGRCYHWGLVWNDDWSID